MAQLDLMGVAEIAVRLGVTKSRARQIAGARGFPEPAARLTMGTIWQTADVEAWIARNCPGAPGTSSTNAAAGTSP